MEVTVPDVLALAMAGLIVVLAGVEIPKIWQEPGARVFAGRMRRNFPYLSASAVDALCRAMPAAVFAFGSLVLAFLTIVIAPATEAQSIPRAIVDVLGLGFGICATFAAFLALLAGLFAAPAWVIPPPFRRN